MGRSFEAGMGAGARSQRDSPSQGRGIGGPAKCVELGGREQGDGEVGSAGCSDRCSPPPPQEPPPSRPLTPLGLGAFWALQRSLSQFILVAPGPRLGNVGGCWSKDSKRDS